MDARNGQPKLMRKGRGRRSAEKFPETLDGFGYRFNEHGQLRQMENPNAGFMFEVKPGDKEYNQRHYEALGEVITEEIYRLLEEKTGVKKIPIPVNASDREARSFFFASDNAWTVDQLIVLIHGSGVVRAGQWSRKLIINEDINTGSQIPYIESAFESGFGVIVLNTNLNRAPNSNGEEVLIRGSEEPLSHALYVWDNFIRGAAARYIAIIAHSAGGYVTVNLADERSNEFMERVFAVAFTDSVHSVKSASPSWEHLLRVSRNWVTSRYELGKKEKHRTGDIERVSAGTLSHERTSPSAIEDIKQFIRQRYEEASRYIEPAVADSAEDSGVTESNFAPDQQPSPSAGLAEELITPKVEHDANNGFEVETNDGPKSEL